jgi:hypothetical protein
MQHPSKRARTFDPTSEDQVISIDPQDRMIHEGDEFALPLR